MAFYSPYISNVMSFIQELLELQRERQTLEKQHQQETNRLNHEIQQARTQHNTLQSQYDKVCTTDTTKHQNCMLKSGQIQIFRAFIS